MRPAFVFTPDLCTGCEACRVACGNENGGGRDTGWRQVVTFNPERHPALPSLHLSLACNHCDVAACANGCPARAYRRDAATGAVLIDAAKCIGCRYCSWVCPYDAPRFDARAGVMTKCTFCLSRLESGSAPACVAACPVGALELGERGAAAAEPAFHGLGAWGLGPALRVVPARRTTAPEGSAFDDGAEPPTFPSRGRKLTLGSEKGLVAFTLAIPALAAWFAGGLLVAARMPPLVVFGALLAAAFLLSTTHLGRPLRAWRAVLGVRTSWLSREAAATGAFAALAVAGLAWPGPGALALRVAALAAALAAVAAMDGVYLVIPRSRGPRLHGAETTTAFLLLAGIAADLLAAAALGALLKVALLVNRSRAGALGMPASLAVLRVTLLAAALTAPLGGWPWTVAFGLALASEALDRAAFYAALEPSTPASRMEEDARMALARPPASA